MNSHFSWILWIFIVILEIFSFSKYFNFVSHLTALRRSAWLPDVTPYTWNRQSVCWVSRSLMININKSYIFASSMVFSISIEDNANTKNKNIFVSEQYTSTAVWCWHFWHDARFLFDAALLSRVLSLAKVTSFKSQLDREYFKQS